MTANHIATRTSTRTDAPRFLARHLARVGIAVLTSALRLRAATAAFAAAGQLGPADDVGLCRHTGSRI